MIDLDKPKYPSFCYSTYAIFLFCFEFVFSYGCFIFYYVYIVANLSVNLPKFGTSGECEWKKKNH